MGEGRQDRIGRLFGEALALPADQRAGFLDQACGDDKQLLAEVVSLLAHHAAASDGFMQPPPPMGCADPGADLVVTLSAGANEDAGRDAPDKSLSKFNLHIDGYEITRELSRGGQGVVYQALQKSTKRKVAIKVLLEGPYASKSAQKRFEREIELVAQLRHPNIISIFHSGTTPDGRAYYVMDYVRGVPLNTYAREKKLPLEETLKLFATVCEGVQYAHQKGVIHRDLKPSNILVDSEGSPKIMDFGLAKLLSGPVETLVSISQEVVGTLPYMSPEQARGNPDEIDTRTDVYALGVILYELLTGHYPYPVVGQLVEVLKHITQTPPTPPTKRWTKDSGVTGRSSTKRLRAGQCPIDDEVQTIALRALSKERERRYQSAGELANDVGHYLAGEAIEAKRDSGWYLLRLSMSRYRRGIATWGAVVLILLAVCGLFGYRYIAKHNEGVTSEAVMRALARVESMYQKLDRMGDHEVSFKFGRDYLKAELGALRTTLQEAEKAQLRPVSADAPDKLSPIWGNLNQRDPILKLRVPTSPAPNVAIDLDSATSMPSFMPVDSLESALSAKEETLGRAEAATTKPSK